MQTMRKEDRRERVNLPGSGLAAWLLTWFQTSLRIKFSGMGKTRAKPRMELIEMLQLGGKRQLMLVLCDGQRYLVGAGGDSIHSIASIRPQAASCTASSAMYEGQTEDGLAAAMQGLEQEIRCSS